MKLSKTILLSIFCLSLAGYAMAQQPQTKPSVLEIRGKGKMNVQPDQTDVYMTVQEVNDDFDQAVTKVNQKLEKLVQKLQSAGFKKDEIKTTNFSVRENGRYRDGEYVRDGYVASQSIILEFKNDKEKLGKLIKSFSTSTPNNTVDLLFNFNFTLSDQKKDEIRDELIRRAIQDARHKASVIAKSSGVKLGKIQSIQYGTAPEFPVPYRESMNMKAMAADTGEGFSNLDVKDLEMTDDIQVVWILE